ncbi:Phosphoserine phosphatase 1 [Paenibacillus auburnensis]|jgi:2,3-bisphosphoglycerate-dependent phosphoglycerate mutase|uniref:Phosphoserine phosphatase 1 n=1 Tax=Paenibacillus auburnensis TaxID=2905649 RepID=A0ABM9CKZ0_9BACL|nr:histidine phosphatase family protein [Paenibacillus auburnensis]CAH1216292.1 Phosphoserine phosphatase 1 [Paenibacillus auburnensis]
MTTIGLIRHGSTLWNKEGRIQGHTDNPLDEEGLEQAAALAERLSTEEWDYIYSSDLLRARQTAEVIAARLGLSIAGLVPGIREMDGGLLEGTTEQELIERWGKDWRTLEIGLEKNESGRLRGSRAIEEIAQRHPGRHVLVVSHGAILRSTLSGLVPELDLSVFLKNTSLTRLVYTGKTWTCELYNCAKHIEN